MADGKVLNGVGKGKVCVETELVMIIGQLQWFADQIEDLQTIAPSLVLRGMVKQLEALVDPVADLRLAVHHA